VGQENDPASGYMAALLVTESVTASGPTWTTTVAPLPANAAANPEAQLSDVVCHSATACAATGSYDSTSGAGQGLLLSWSGKTWTPIEAQLPADAAASPDAGFVSVACPSATSCVAAGSYVDSSGNFEAVLLTGWEASWTPSETPLPANTATPANVQLHTVACQSATSCLAVGQYLDSSGNTQALIVTGSQQASWQATQAPLPASASTPAELWPAACAPTTWCFAAGSSQTGDALLETGAPA
jgi:hypothetical protein